MPRTKLPAVVREEQKKQRLEAAALAAYQMEMGTYHFPEGTHRGVKLEDGSRGWNKAEILRVYGHHHSGHPDIVFEDPHFKRMVEYHRWRGSDPMFRKKIQNQVWKEIADEVSLQIYEKVKFSPDSLSYDQKLKTIKLIIDAGVKLGSEKTKDHSTELLEGMNPEERKALLEEQVKHQQLALANLKSLASAYEAGEVIDGEAE